MKKTTQKYPYPVIILIFIFITLPFATYQVFAQDEPPTDDDVNEIAKELYCPVCENVPLDECVTEACQQWRDLIKQLLNDGLSEQEIKAHFVEQYGNKVLGEPPKSGLNWLLYLLPPIFIFGGLVMLFRKLQSSKKGEKNNKSDDDLYMSMVNRDLDNLG